MALKLLGDLMDFGLGAWLQKVLGNLDRTGQYSKVLKTSQLYHARNKGGA